MALINGGRNPAAYKSVDRTNFYATAGQTTFTLSQGYTVGDVDVYLNGIRLVDADDYIAINGSTVVLTSAAALNDHLLVISYNQFYVANTYTKTESDSKYMTASGLTPMSSYLRTPNYGITSTSDSLSASMEASALAGEQGVGIKAFGRSMATYGGDILYTSDSRGAGGRHRFGYWNGTSFTNSMTIDTSGRVTMHNQPIASVSYSGTDVSSTTVVPLNNRPITRGGMVISNNRITVPISGTYVIGYHHLATSNGCQISIRVNGTDINGGGGSRTQGHAPTNHDNMSVQNPTYINANEYIEFVVINSTMHGNADYNRMYAYMIG